PIASDSEQFAAHRGATLVIERHTSHRALAAHRAPRRYARPRADHERLRYARAVAKSIYETVREVCLSFPETEEVVSHGFPDFRVRGKTFATYSVNHHGDGRVALLLNAPTGSQDHYVKNEPKHFFVPPYVGPRGWVGVDLNKGLSWRRIPSIVRQAYE